jgi:D-alanyl-D-alanine carboxypeptidase (penicillin-binding protein 5/6)
MALPIFQFILVGLVRLIVSGIWVVDAVTNVNFLRLGKLLSHISVRLVSIIFGVALMYAYSTGALTQVAESFFAGELTYLPIKSFVTKYPLLVRKTPTPQVTAKSFLIIDKSTSKILASYDETRKLPPASTAKLMTALVALDIYNPTDVLLVPEICTKIDSTKAYLPVGGRFTVVDLIYSMLIGSAGDSACVLSAGKLPYEKFVSLMNRKASLIGLTNTRFANPIGLDDIDGLNFTTSFDLYNLSKIVMDNPVITDAVKRTSYDLKSLDGKYAATLFTTNQLLWEIPNTLGIKTGTTTNAGEVFVYDYADAEKNLIIVVMGSKDRFADTRSLLYWALNSYTWKKS